MTNLDIGIQLLIPIFTINMDIVSGRKVSKFKLAAKASFRRPPIEKTGSRPFETKIRDANRK